MGVGASFAGYLYMIASEMANWCECEEVRSDSLHELGRQRNSFNECHVAKKYLGLTFRGSRIERIGEIAISPLLLRSCRPRDLVQILDLRP